MQYTRSAHAVHMQCTCSAIHCIYTAHAYLPDEVHRQEYTRALADDDEADDTEDGMVNGGLRVHISVQDGEHLVWVRVQN